MPEVEEEIVSEPAENIEHRTPKQGRSARPFDNRRSLFDARPSSPPASFLVVAERSA
jgi:hypothetical protein